MQQFFTEIAAMVLAKSDGEILAEILSEFEISKTSLSKKLGVNRATIHGWLINKNKFGISFDNWVLIGEKLKIDIFERVPKLKKMKRIAGDSKEGISASKISDLEDKYNAQAKDVEFLKERISDFNEIIQAKNELIEIQRQRLIEKDKIIKELKDKLKR